MVSHQVVKVSVLNCEPSKERMLLSFKLLSDPKKEHAGRGQKKGKTVNVGQVHGLLQTSCLGLQLPRAGAPDTWVTGTRGRGRAEVAS